MKDHSDPVRRACAAALATVVLALAAATVSGGTAGAATAADTTTSPTTRATPTTNTETTRRAQTTVPTSPTTNRAAALCAYQGRIAPGLWKVLVRIFDVRCDPRHPTTTTTTTTRPGGVQNCGSFDTAAGWPTTFARQRADCLLNAFAAGTPARYVLYTAPSASSNRRVSNIYEVIGVQRVRVTVDATAYGGDTITVSECTGLTDNGNLQATGCTVVETRPVVVAPTQTRLVLTPTGPIVAGQSVVLTAAVVDETGQPVTTGTITLREANDSRGTVRVESDGKVAFTITRPVGIWYFHAEYNGSTGFAPSTSEAVRFEVVPA
jgi:hypothetical protein